VFFDRFVKGDYFMSRAVFLDRDGTINLEKEYLYRIEDFEFVTGAEEAIRLLNQAGYFVVVVTNQSGVARGYYTEEDVEILHSEISARLAAKGAHVDAWYYCPHHPAGKGSYALPCSCRKPLPGMLLSAADRYGLNLEESIMIGDKLIDVEAALAAGCRPILVRSGYGSVEQEGLSQNIEVSDDLLSAVRSLVIGNEGV
jgi:D-glycero-D-manno-heptose 1,7-bisphosphate phosphatase